MSLVPLAALSLLASPALAAVQSPTSHHESGLVVADDVAPVRLGRTLATQPPALARSSASAFYSDGWTIRWDSDTGVPTRIFGKGRHFDGSVADPARALAAAEQVLAEQIALLAPGSSVSDFVLAANIERNGVRMVNFIQHHRGLPIVGAYIGFRFKADRLIVVASEALPDVSVAELAAPMPGFAATAATAWIDSDFGTRSAAVDVGDAVIVPLVHGAGNIEYRAALPVTVENRGGAGEWTVYVGPDENAFGRISTIHFAEGNVLYNVPERWPGGGRADFPAAFATQNVDGAPQTADGTGLVTFAGASASINTGLTGTFVAVNNQNGNSSTNLTLNDGDSVTWTGGDVNELLDAELAVFVHTNIAQAEARLLAPGLAALNQPLQANVNGTFTECNAFAGGNSINFFVASMPAPNLTCGNTGTLADVIYHEYGHFFHINTIDQTGVGFDSAFSEGLSDYYAASITGDFAMGRGFFTTDEPLRPIDGPGGDIYWPQAFWDDVDTHYTGVVFAGAMWDLRLALIAELGESAGDDLADRLFYGAVQRATSVDTTYLEVLTEDDDDGNLANGTPNQCAIDYAFGTHGFGPARSVLGEGLELHTRDRFTISIAEKTPASGCPAPAVDSMEIFWRLRSDPATSGTEAMALAGGAWSGTIPTQPEGEVIEYQITINYADGNLRRVPLNFSNPFYEFFNGATEEIYCTDFETDPFADGWTEINFEHGAPNGGENNTDPPAAFSGTNVVGVVLGGNGAYGNNAITSLDSPVIDVSGRDNVRLQFQRWLNVPDGQLDQAVITANDEPVWVNKVGEFLFVPEQHLDHEWKFTDIDLAAQAASGSVKVGFDLNGGGRNNGSNRLGGWTIDDFCIVAFVPSVCGDSEVTGNEECDDGANNSNEEADACRADCTAASCGDGITDATEECDDGNDIDDDDCSNTCIDLGGGGGGCGCQSSGSGGAGGFLLLGLFALVGLRRRRLGGRA